MSGLNLQYKDQKNKDQKYIADVKKELDEAETIGELDIIMVPIDSEIKKIADEMDLKFVKIMEENKLTEDEKNMVLEYIKEWDQTHVQSLQERLGRSRYDQMLTDLVSVAIQGNRFEKILTSVKGYYYLKRLNFQLEDARDVEDILMYVEQYNKKYGDILDEKHLSEVVRPHVHRFYEEALIEAADAKNLNEIYRNMRDYRRLFLDDGYMDEKFFHDRLVEHVHPLYEEALEEGSDDLDDLHRHRVNYVMRFVDEGGINAQFFYDRWVHHVGEMLLDFNEMLLNVGDVPGIYALAHDFKVSEHNLIAQIDENNVINLVNNWANAIDTTRQRIFDANHGPFLERLRGAILILNPLELSDVKEEFQGRIDENLLLEQIFNTATEMFAIEYAIITGVIDEEKGITQIIRLSGADIQDEEARETARGAVERMKELVNVLGGIDEYILYIIDQYSVVLRTEDISDIISKNLLGRYKKEMDEVVKKINNGEKLVKEMKEIIERYKRYYDVRIFGEEFNEVENTANMQIMLDKELMKQDKASRSALLRDLRFGVGTNIPIVESGVDDIGKRFRDRKERKRNVPVSHTRLPIFPRHGGVTEFSIYSPPRGENKEREVKLGPERARGEERTGNRELDTLLDDIDDLLDRSESSGLRDASVPEIKVEFGDVKEEDFLR